MTAFADGIDALLADWWALHPVDASFAGESAFDGRLGAGDAGATARERAALCAMQERLDALIVPDDASARLDVRMLRATIAQALRESESRPRQANPAWYTGEIAFGMLFHLLRDGEPRDPAALRARMSAGVDLAHDGARALAGRPLPRPWVIRATAEAHAIERLVRSGIARHPGRAAFGELPVEALGDALSAFTAAIAPAPDADPACGAAFLQAIVRGVHGLAESLDALERRARSAFDAATERLTEAAARRDTARSWREQLDRLSDDGPADRAGALASYVRWHERAMRAASFLVTPADDYGLTFTPLPAWTAGVIDDLYVLFYRSPPARASGSGSTYWVAGLDAEPAALRSAHATATVKIVHAVHHGSIGHHTQNARARASRSRVGRVAGTDGAMGIAMLGGGTMIEGWACYVEDLLAEVPDFYTPLETLQLTALTRRNAACCLADLRLHRGDWSLDEMRAFYRDDVGFAPARIVPETTRNSMFPGSRVMYWTGTDAIEALRRRAPFPAKTFHDRLLAYGSLPVPWIAEEEETAWLAPARS